LAFFLRIRFFSCERTSALIRPMLPAVDPRLPPSDAAAASEWESSRTRCFTPRAPYTLSSHTFQDLAFQTLGPRASWCAAAAVMRRCRAAKCNTRSRTCMLLARAYMPINTRLHAY
jgi:hypothetical protein